MGRRERQATLLLVGAIALGLLVRLLIFRGQGFPSDVGTFMAWAERMASGGPANFYEPGYFSDYPPGFLYVLWVIGALFDGEALRLVVKALSIPADIAIAVLLARVVRPYAGPIAGAAAGALWMLQPGAIIAGPFWGQVDAWGTLPFLAALIAAGRDRWLLAGVLAGVAGMVKPQFGLAALVVVAAAAFEFVQRSRSRPLIQAIGGGLGVALLLALPFRMSPGAYVDLVRAASETYPYTSLYAFNVWSIVGDFWKPDAPYVVLGGILLILGLVGSVAALWGRRDLPMFLVAGALAAMAFYFLPTRAHERYLYPAFALLVPFAVTRGRVLVPYIVLSLAFFTSLYFAFTRYPQNGIVPAPLLEATLFSRSGQIALALVMIGSSAFLAWRLVRGEARLTPTVALPGIEPAAPRRWTLPAGLGRGHAPTRRDVTVALLAALMVLASRGFLLDHPRDMYFDEVYHARTAFELLAQREPYEWTHPHLAKEIIALGILAFGGDRVAATESEPGGITAFAVSADGARAYGFADGRVTTSDRMGTTARITVLDGPVRALAFDGGSLYAASDRSVVALRGDGTSGAAADVSPGGLRFTDGPPTSFAATGGRAIVGTARNVQIVRMGEIAPPLVVPIPVAALTAKPDSNEVFVADPTGAIHVVDVTTGRETGAPIVGGPPVSALAYARGPDRIFGARAGEAAIEWYEPSRAEATGPRQGSHAGSVALSNGRIGTRTGTITALALVPRTQFLYALAGDDLVVIETHGASPFAAIPVRGTMLGVDGTGDRLLVAGDGATELVDTGRHALSWRIPGVAFASALAFLIVLLARRLFASPLLPILAAAFVILDGSMFAQSRIGMNDIYVATFLIAGWYFVVAAHAPRRSARLDLVLAGICFGLALATKWVAAYSLGALGLYAIVATAWAWGQGRVGGGGPFDLFAWRAVVPRDANLALRGGAWVSNAFFLFACFVLVPVAIYLASYWRWYGGPTIPFGWDQWQLTQQMYWYHSALTAPHPAGSPWWSWPLVLKPVYWYLGQPGQGATAVIYNAGNVILYWGGLAAAVWAAVAAVRARSVALGFLVFVLLAQFVAWIPITRVLFFYHFFTALPFYLLILAAALAALWETGRRSLVVAFTALAGAAFLFFYPFVSGLPVPADQAGVFYILPTWQYDCQFYPDFHCQLAIRGDLPFAAAAGRLAMAAGAALIIFAVVTGLLGDGRRERILAAITARAPRRTAPRSPR